MLHIYQNTKDYYDQLIEKINTAQRDVSLCTCGYNSGSIATRLNQAFDSAVSRGVRATVVIDRFGTITDAKGMHTIGNLQMYSQMKQKGITILFSPSTPFGNLHTKMCAVDSEYLTIGGSNIADWYTTNTDTNFVITDKLPNMHQIIHQLGTSNKNNLPPVQLNQIQIEFHCPSLNPIYEARICDLIDNSQKYLLMTAWYFNPSRVIKEALIRASQRNVKIDIVVSKKNGVPGYASLLYHTVIKRLNRHNINFHIYSGNNHSKIILNESSALIGSANLDNTSKYISREAMVTLTDTNQISKLKNIVQAMQSHSTLVKS